MNKIMLSGRVAKEVNLKYLPKTGLPISEFDLAVPREKGDATDFLPIQVKGKYAETIANNLDVGQLIIVEGRVETDIFKNKNNKNVKMYKVVTNHIEFVSYNNKNNKKFDGVINEDDVRGDEFSGKNKR